MSQQQSPEAPNNLGLRLAVASTALLVIVLFFATLSTRSELYDELEQQQLGALQQAERTIANYVTVAQRDLSFISRSPLLQERLSSDADANQSTDWRPVEREWLTLMQSRADIYDQLRFLDLSGREQVRINNTLPDASVVPRSALQAKIDRYYVAQSLELPVGSIYLSAFDLNVEQGVVEVPLKPTLRMLTPVAGPNGEKAGLVGLNYKGANMLAALGKITDASDLELWLVNEQGYWLKGPSPELEWQFMYLNRPPLGIADSFPELWQKLLTSSASPLISLNESGYQLSARAVDPKLGLDGFDSVVRAPKSGWILVTAASESAIQARLMPIMTAMLPGFAIVEIILVALSLWGGRLIRQRQLAWLEIETRERQLTVIFESAPDATLLSNTDGIITRANTSIERLLGYTPEELVGQSIDILVPSRIHSIHGSLRKHYYLDPVPRAVTSRSRLTATHKEGHEVPVSVALNSLVVDGETQVLSAVRDMTADHLASTKIIELNQRLEIATAAASIGIWELDTHDGSLQWDSQVYRHYGLSQDARITLSDWLEQLAKEDAQRFNRHLGDIALDGSHFDIVVQASNSRGEEVWMRLIATTKLAEDGFTQIIIGTELDVTEQVRVERELRVSYEMASEANAQLAGLNRELEESRTAAEAGSRIKGEFLANMSHEIRTPLNAVIGINHLLARQLVDGQTGDLVRKQERAAQSLLGVINDILDYSKIESGKLELERSPFSLFELLDNLVTLVGEQAQQRGLNFVIEPPPIEHSHVVGDYLRLEQVMVNLCSNAIKFTEQGEVRVVLRYLSTNANKVNIKFSVQDTGVGISSAEQAQLFTPFSQADASVSRRYGGTGLGLSIASNLVQLMGGEISFQSEVGKGSDFNFVLSLSRQAFSRQQLTALAGRSVMLAHSNRLLRTGLASMLSAYGAQVSQFEGVDDLVGRVLDDNRLQTPECIALLDGDTYLPPDLQTQVVELQRLAPQCCPSLVVVCSTPEALEQEFAALIEGVDVLQYPIGPVALYKQLSKQVQSGEAESAEGQSEERLAGVRILLVDDNAINLDVAKMMFEDEGARVWLASDGAAALQKLNRPDISVDLVLMDVQMPVMDGLETTRRIRSDADLATLPVIALTAGVTSSQRSAAIEAGMNGFITKPVDMERAVALVKSIVAGQSLTSPWQEAHSNEIESEAGTGVDPVVLNQEYGLRVFKTRGSYQRFLRLFIRMYEPAVVQIPGLMDKPDELQSLAHKIRGVAGHLGLDQVRELCADIENQVSESLPYAQSVEELITALNSSFAEIDRIYPEEAPVESAPETNLDPQQLIEALKPLQMHLTNYDLDSADALFQGLKSELTPGDRDALQNAIDLFDSKLALEELERISANLNNSTTTAR